MSVRILLVDDHTILREGMRRSFDAAGEKVVGEASDGEEAVAKAIELRPDVTLMDVSMPVLDGIGATKRIREQVPDARVIVLTMHDEGDTRRLALEAGAVGFLTKGASFADVLKTVRDAATGDTGLSPELATSMLEAARRAPAGASEPLLSDRQVEILQSIANGATTKQVARQLGITQKTVHNHLNAIYRKLDTQSLTHAVLSAVRLGIIELD